MILAFGLIGLLTGIFIFGIIAWIMGNSDLAEMSEGHMDPEGEGMTQAGRIMGMISVIFAIVAIFAFCGFFGCAVLLPFVMIGGMAAGAANQPVNQRPIRKF